MPLTTPAPQDSHPRKRIAVAETEISYVETGNFGGFEIVFLHGNPTSSYLWRNVIPHVGQLGHCYAPDLMGMGESGPTPNKSYRFIDHSITIDGWFNALDLKNVVIVGHDWGGARLGSIGRSAIGIGLRWSHLVGQFGSEVKVYSAY